MPNLKGFLGIFNSFLMPISKQITKIFFAFLIFFLAFGWLVVFFAVIGSFYAETVVLSITASAIFSLLFSKKLYTGAADIQKMAWIPVIVIALAVSFTTCYFATPTIFGGRDQGAISTAAIYLAKDHQLKFSTPVSGDLFQKYGSGKALNYPGFDYTKDGKLFSRFPVAFTAYLAASYEMFGLTGIQYANWPFLFLFLVVFWLILREFFSKWISLLGFLLAASFFPFLWFAKYTLTETYMLFLVWAGVLFLIYYLKEKKDLFFYLSLAAFSLSALVRIEGMVFLFLAIGYVYLLERKKMILRPIFHKYLSGFLAFFLLLYFFLNYSTLLDSLKNIVKTFLPGSEKISGPSANLYSHLILIFLNYNILVYIIGGLLAMIFLLIKFRNNFFKKEYIPLIILFPALVYLFLPLITLDDPWMLRRYVFAVFPLLILYSLYAFEKFFYHRFFLYFALSVLIIANIFTSGIFLKTSENKALLPQIKEISQNFGPRDLILVDRLATGSGWSLMSEPLASLYSQQAVYFFNADDLKAIDQSRYDHVYLLTPLTSEKAWYSEMIKDMNRSVYKIVTVNNNYLESQPGIFKVAVDIHQTLYTGIWKIK